MTNLIQKIKLKTPELIAIKWDGDGMSAYEIKSMLANHGIGVFYIATDDWHRTLTSEEQQGLVYYNPYLVINTRWQEVRFEKDQYLILNPEASSSEPKVSIMSEEELRNHYEFLPEDPVEDRPAGDEVVPEAGQEEDHDNGSEGPREELPAGSEGPGEAGGETSEEEEQEVTDPEPITHEPVPTPEPEEELKYDNAPDDDQAEGSDYRAVEDLAGHGDGELRERDSLGGESGEPDHEDEPNV